MQTNEFEKPIRKLIRDVLVEDAELSALIGDRVWLAGESDITVYPAIEFALLNPGFDSSVVGLYRMTMQLRIYAVGLDACSELLSHTRRLLTIPEHRDVMERDDIRITQMQITDALGEPVALRQLDDGKRVRWLPTTWAIRAVSFA